MVEIAMKRNEWTNWLHAKIKTQTHDSPSERKNENENPTTETRTTNYYYICTIQMKKKKKRRNDTSTNKTMEISFAIRINEWLDVGHFFRQLFFDSLLCIFRCAIIFVQRTIFIRSTVCSAFARIAWAIFSLLIKIR